MGYNKVSSATKMLKLIHDKHKVMNLKLFMLSLKKLLYMQWIDNGYIVFCPNMCGLQKVEGLIEVTLNFNNVELNLACTG